METKPSLSQAGHLTNLGSSDSNHERPHSQRILYTCRAVTEPHFSSWTSIPLAIAPCVGAPFRPTRRPGAGNLPGSVVRSFTTSVTTEFLTVLSVSPARGVAIRGRSRHRSLKLSLTAPRHFGRVTRRTEQGQADRRRVDCRLGCVEHSVRYRTPGRLIRSRRLCQTDAACTA